MSPTASDVLRLALSLDEADRAAIAGALIESLERAADSNPEDAWAREIERRVVELERRSVPTVAWSEVRERLFRGFE